MLQKSKSKNNARRIRSKGIMQNVNFKENTTAARSKFERKCFKN